MGERVPWQGLAIRGAVVTVAVLLFQQLGRGEITPVVAIAVGVGYVVVFELVRRRT